MSTARDFRGRYPDHLCPVDDDARTKTVCFVSDTPEHIIEEARDVATTEQAEAEEESLDPVELSGADKRRLDFSREGVNVPKARYLKSLGERYSVDPFDHVDLAEIDAVRDAEPILERARRSGGTNRGGGTARFDDEAAARERRERRAGAEQARSEECNHAEDHCANGDPEACEFLQEVCGLSEEEVADMADLEPDMRADPDDPSEGEAGDLFDRLDGPSKGAYARSWGGYQAATEAIQEAVEQAVAGLDDAHDAARAINGIRAEEGADPIHFERLEQANAAMLDLLRHAARTCHECHAQHGEEPDGLDHEVAATGREDIRRFVTAGGRETSVGNPDGIGPATNEPEEPPEWAAQADISDFGAEEGDMSDDTPTPDGDDSAPGADEWTVYNGSLPDGIVQAYHGRSGGLARSTFVIVHRMGNSPYTVTRTRMGEGERFTEAVESGRVIGGGQTETDAIDTAIDHMHENPPVEQDDPPDLADMATVAEEEPPIPRDLELRDEPGEMSDRSIMAAALRDEAQQYEGDHPPTARRYTNAAQVVESDGWRGLSETGRNLLVDALAGMISAANRNNRPDLERRAREALAEVEGDDTPAVADMETVAAEEPPIPRELDRGATTADATPREERFGTPDFEQVKPSISRKPRFTTIRYPREIPMFERVDTVIDAETVDVMDLDAGSTYPAQVDLVWRHTDPDSSADVFHVAAMRGAPESAPPRHGWTVATWGGGRDEWIKQATAEAEALPQVVAQVAASAREMLTDSGPQLVGMETVAEEEPPLPREMTVEQEMFFADRDDDGDPQDVIEREQQRTLGGGRTDPQATFAGVPDEPGGASEVEEEAASEFGVDDRSEAGRGADDAPETEERTLGEATGGFDAREAGQGGFDDFEEDTDT